MRAFLAQLPYLPLALRQAWTAAHYWSVAWLALLLVQGLLPVATVYLTRALVNSLAASLGAGNDWAAFQPTLVLAVLMAGLLLLAEGLRVVAGWIRTVQSELIQDHISNLIHTQATGLDLSFYDTPEYYDRLHRARVGAFNRPVLLLENAGSLLQNGITLIAMAGVLTSFGLWVPIVLFCGTLPALYIVAHYTWQQYQWRLSNTTAERRIHYYDWMLTARETAAELRLFALGGHFRSAFQTLRRRLRTEQRQLTRYQALAELAASAVALASSGAALAWMVWRTVQGQVTLGDMALFYQAFSQGQRLMRSLLENVGQIYGNVLFLENLFEFLALKPQVVDPPQPTPPSRISQNGIYFQDVTFRYPGSEHTTLNQFNLTIPSGQIAAIVGANGAGKSTVVKLLCRFYDPTEGSITLGGVDLRDLPMEGLRGRVTALFQEPVRHHDTAAKNIAFGELGADSDAARIEGAAEAAGADELIRRLPLGYETVLGKWFGGAELSVGEWQRVALARAFLRQASIVLLDEPTSAMDSWAEADWMERFRTLVAGSTALIITHRLTTAMHADTIHVMEAGRIVEYGSHTELLAFGGQYAQSWQAQMRENTHAGLS